MIEFTSLIPPSVQCVTIFLQPPQVNSRPWSTHKSSSSLPEPLLYRPLKAHSSRCDHTGSLTGSRLCAVGTKSLQPCLTLCNPMNHNPPGYSVHGILQARILDRAAMPFSRESSQPRDQTWLLGLLHWQAGSYHLAPPAKPLAKTPSTAFWPDLPERNFSMSVELCPGLPWVKVRRQCFNNFIKQTHASERTLGNGRGESASIKSLTGWWKEVKVLSVEFHTDFLSRRLACPPPRPSLLWGGECSLRHHIYCYEVGIHTLCTV